MRYRVLHFERFRQIIRRRRYATLAMRNAGDLQAHLDAAQGSCQHQIVKITEVSNAESLVLQFAEAGAERHVEALQNHLAEAIGGVAGGRIYSLSLIHI